MLQVAFTPLNSCGLERTTSASTAASPPGVCCSFDVVCGSGWLSWTPKVEIKGSIELLEFKDEILVADGVDKVLFLV